MTAKTSTPRPIQTLLVANRNEIAVRIIRAAKSLGMRTVAVYSEADAQALHVQQADEAWCLGGPAPLDSYLKIERLIEVALACGADAIHPGYGFVSENPALPKACIEAGLVLVGPDEQAMRDMADKARAKEIAQVAGLPCVPGFNKAGATLADFEAAAEQMGYPVMVKALAGGGGRGMRLVQQANGLAAALHSAQQEAGNAFGDDRVMLEKAVMAPRHVEIQVLADQHGHAIHLGERDCSVQRRHQKIVEEAPSPAVDEALRARMGEAALRLVHATGYVGAGTVEFLLDAQGDFYFIEMNTRLQVEHGVTELITGVDLVQWQLRIAAGEPLSLRQSDIKLNGHAIQGRLCAEDPAQDFMPQTGPILAWQAPHGAHLRVDHALQAGLEVSPFYDSMLAKVMAHGPNRLAACRALADALSRTELVGFEHNARYLQRIAEHTVFQQGQFSTAFLSEWGETLLEGKKTDSATDAEPTEEAICPVAGLVAALFFTQVPQVSSPSWPTGLSGFSSTQALARRVHLKVGDNTIDTVVHPVSMGFELRFPDVPSKENLQAERAPAIAVVGWTCQARPSEPTVCQCEIEGRPVRASVYPADGGVWVRVEGNPQARWIENLSYQSSRAAAGDVFTPDVKSPMNGKVLQVCVEAGQSVCEGELLATLEAMKMEHQLVARHDAVVESVLVQVGEQMGQGQVMIKLKEAN